MLRGKSLLGLSLLVVACSGPVASSPAEPPSVPEGSSPAEPPSAETPFVGLEGFWSEAQAREILDQTGEFSVRADASSLPEAERAALPHLLEAGEAMARIYRSARHPDALAVRAHFDTYAPTNDAERAQLTALRDLELLFAGPVVRTVAGGRETLGPVAAYRAGRNLYPEGVTAEELRALSLAHPELHLLDVRSVVRRRTEASLEADRHAMSTHPWLAALHPTLAARLDGPADETAYYGVPYSLAYADDLLSASRSLFAAADLLEASAPDFAAYLAQRARDLLTNDYEGGDALWVTAEPAALNLQLGAYETYDDHLTGQKAFASASILIRDVAASERLAAAIAHLPELERALPGGPYGEVRTSIPIGIYDVLADFGQARGGNTASILPNEAAITRRHGRTILIRRNILENPVLLGWTRARFAAEVNDAHVDDLLPSGSLDRTVWHEVGHYLGPKTTTDGRTVTEALGELHNTFEELKADLVSLWSIPRLEALGVIDASRAHAMYAAGIHRTMVTTRPAATDPYQTMQLMQQNWLIERGVLRFDEDTQHFAIDYAPYPAAVEAMLTEVLAIQRAGDGARAQAFIDRWAIWNDAVQGVVGPRIGAAAPRWTLPRYEALGESVR